MAMREDVSLALSQAWASGADALKLYSKGLGDAVVPGQIAAKARAYVRDASAIAQSLGDGYHGWIIEQVERELIERLAVQCNGNKTHMARKLGVHRNTLRTRMQQLGMVVQ